MIKKFERWLNSGVSETTVKRLNFAASVVFGSLNYCAAGIVAELFIFGSIQGLWPRLTFAIVLASHFAKAGNYCLNNDWIIRKGARKNG